MNKTILIIQREYLTRVKKKTFLLTTFLVPILMFSLITLFVFISLKSEQKQTIIVQDDSHIFENKFSKENKSYLINFYNGQSNEKPKEILEKNNGDIYVHIYPFSQGKIDSVVMYKEGGLSIATKEFIGGQINAIYRIKQMEDAGIDKNKIDKIQDSYVAIKSYDLKDNKESNAEIASGLGYFMGFLIYMVIFIYGSGVMRGVMEEKTNRIAEVIISSVKPFQLMMGKIIGIALVGLTQFLLWIILLFVLQALLPILIPDLANLIQDSHNIGVGSVPVDMNEITNNQEAIFSIKALSNINWSLIIFCFIFYFLGGYLLYASMFAAVGSLVNEDPQEAQQLTIPISMPIIFGFIIMATSLKDPNSPLAVFGSLFPFTSPIVMLARIPFGIPTWQIITSMILLVIGFVFMTWLSAKIYRTGILMYGKKASWKEIFKWVRYS